MAEDSDGEAKRIGLMTARLFSGNILGYTVTYEEFAALVNGSRNFIITIYGREIVFNLDRIEVLEWRAEDEADET